MEECAYGFAMVPIGEGIEHHRLDRRSREYLHLPLSPRRFRTKPRAHRHRLEHAVGLQRGGHGGASTPGYLLCPARRGDLYRRVGACLRTQSCHPRRVDGFMAARKADSERDVALWCSCIERVHAWPNERRWMSKQ